MNLPWRDPLELLSCLKWAGKSLVPATGMGMATSVPDTQQQRPRLVYLFLSVTFIGNLWRLVPLGSVVP